MFYEIHGMFVGYAAAVDHARVCSRRQTINSARSYENWYMLFIHLFSHLFASTIHLFICCICYVSVVADRRRCLMALQYSFASADARSEVYNICRMSHVAAIHGTILVIAQPTHSVLYAVIVNFNVDDLVDIDIYDDMLE